MHPRPTLAALLAPAFLIALLTALLPGSARAGDQRWYVLEMQGQRAGWLAEGQATNDGLITSESRTNLTIRRGDTTITLDISSAFTESHDGSPISMTATTNFGGSESTDRYTWNNNEIAWTSTQSGRSSTQTLAPPEGRWLTPAAAADYLAARLKAGADTITTRTLDPLNGLDPVTTTRSDFETVTIEVLGRSVEAIRCTALSSLQPGSPGTEYLDSHGRLLRSEMQIGGITLNILAADEQLARADLDPPELMRAVFVTPDRPIRDPYRRARSAFTVSATEGDMPDLPTTGTQHAERLDATSIRITRDLTTPPATDTAAPEPTTAPSAMLTADDPRVAELTQTALTAAPDDPRKRAERLRRFVHRHIRTKDLSVGFASAAETARTREGDCTEHAVLLAAMCRADGIPARVVSGLIYADRFAGGKDIFGYHMWTQAFLPTGPATAPNSEPRWTDLDATLPDSLPMTATHIALGLPDLEGDNRVNALVQLAPLMGRLAITVEPSE